jgi:Flp pilus assembly protein TadG
MMRLARSLWRNVDGAIAPLTGLALFGLIAAGGVAFDYARLATMDTELQQAADQAALAAATQLDRSDDSQTRAATAIQDPDDTHRLASNLTRFANDGNGTGVTIDSIKFCSAFDDSVQDTDAACTETNDGTTSQFVIVTTEIRTADYAFTPIVAAFRGNSQASAVAGVASSICNVAPLLVCAPNDDFPTDADIGKGIIMKVAGGNQWVPGNYGYLDFGNGNQAVLDALLGNGLNGCQTTGETQTEPGNKNATDAINTRMDVYGGNTKNPSVCNLATGSGCPAPNTRKDETLTMTWTKSQPASDPAPTVADVPACGTAATGNGNPNPSLTYTNDWNGNNWNQASAATHVAGFPRDTCHYTSCTGGNFGDAAWDRTSYLAANHPGVSASDIASAIGGDATAAKLTRFQVYSWEESTAHAMDPLTIGSVSMTSSTGNGKNPQTTYTFTKQCSFPQPRFGSTAYPPQRDRRILPVVAANCNDLKGKGSAFVDFKILRVFDVFLTEPSLKRTAAQTGVAGATTGTDDQEIYGEVIGPSQTFGGTNGFQFFARNKPYLVR